MTKSEFTGEQQVFEHTGQWWEGVIGLPKMIRSTAAPWEAFFASLAGVRGTFLLRALQKTPLVPTPVPTVNGAGQTGKSIALSGSGTIKKGDYFQLGSGATSRLHMNMGADVTLPATVDIFPRLRESPANGSAVVVTNPAGLFRLARPVEWDIELILIFGLEFEAVEAI
jgi:hypothetical protein